MRDRELRIQKGRGAVIWDSACPQHAVSMILNVTTLITAAVLFILGARVRCAALPSRAGIGIITSTLPRFS
jgi:hypothetical protein